MNAFFILSIALALLYGTATVDGFCGHQSKVFRGNQMKPCPLYVVINSKNRENRAGRKPETSPNRIRRDYRNSAKNSAKKELSSFFGFTSTAELLNGRFAMIFFLLGIHEELKTGKSMLQQAGLVNQDQQINGLMFAALFGSMALYPSITKWVTKLSAMRLQDPEN